ncbi:MAG: hypothetical protein WBW33_37300 [Bryobacteraceae bacterium]
MAIPLFSGVKPASFGAKALFRSSRSPLHLSNLREQRVWNSAFLLVVDHGCVRHVDHEGSSDSAISVALRDQQPGMPAAVNPIPLSACCKKGPCPDTREHSQHSGCQMQTTNTERPALPESPLQSSRSTMLSESQLPAEQVVPAVHASALLLFTPDYLPPDLFLQNSSFLI